MSVREHVEAARADLGSVLADKLTAILDRTPTPEIKRVESNDWLMHTSLADVVRYCEVGV